MDLEDEGEDERPSGLPDALAEALARKYLTRLADAVAARDPQSLPSHKSGQFSPQTARIIFSKFTTPLHGVDSYSVREWLSKNSVEFASLPIRVAIIQADEIRGTAFDILNYTLSEDEFEQPPTWTEPMYPVRPAGPPGLPPETFQWIVDSIAGGIVGNLSYDILKRLMKTARRQLRKTSDRTSDELEDIAKIAVREQCARGEFPIPDLDELSTMSWESRRKSLIANLHSRKSQITARVEIPREELDRYGVRVNVKKLRHRR